MKLHTMSKTCFALLAASAFLGAVGCTGQPTATSIRTNPTPRLQSLTRSYQENMNLIVRTQNNRLRAIHDDIQTAFFLNRNTGLTEYEYPLR